MYLHIFHYIYVEYQPHHSTLMGHAIRFIGAIFWYVISLTINMIYQRKPKPFSDVWQNDIQHNNPFHTGKYAAHQGLLTLLGWILIILFTSILFF